MSNSEYIKLADAIAQEIASGTLKQGDQLPPQRHFAYDRKIAVSTASRVYAELLRRGLVVGEVGRGTFIAAQPKSTVQVREPFNDGRVDLEYNYPFVSGQLDLISRSLGGRFDPNEMDLVGHTHPTSTGPRDMREAAARYFAKDGWAPKADDYLFTGNGKQAIAAAFGALVPNGGRLGVEAMTYPFIKGVAKRLGITLVPLAVDEAGVRPDAIEKAHHEAKLSALYLQPTLHNPLGMTMPAARRTDIVKLVERLDIPIIEDAIYAFLSDEPPLAALTPNRCVVLDSTSKRIAPGFSLGFINTPPRLREGLMASVRSGGWAAPGIAFVAIRRMIENGTADELVKLKREEARQRQFIAAERLSGFDILANPHCFHVWLNLPGHWRSETFVAAASRRGIAITSSSAFAVNRGHAPNAVRLALGAPSLERLNSALETLAQMLAAEESEMELAG